MADSLGTTTVIFEGGADVIVVVGVNARAMLDFGFGVGV